MTCYPFKDETGKVVGFACTRGSRAKLKRCATCGTQTDLLCDGCDRPVCAACSVAPVSKQDFDPACFAPAWKAWLKAFPAMAQLTQPQRRVAFRAWVRHHPQLFAELVVMTRAGRAAAEASR